MNKIQQEFSCNKSEEKEVCCLMWLLGLPVLSYRPCQRWGRGGIVTILCNRIVLGLCYKMDNFGIDIGNFDWSLYHLSINTTQKLIMILNSS
jgi:hypothetical protein